MKIRYTVLAVAMAASLSAQASDEAALLKAIQDTNRQITSVRERLLSPVTVNGQTLSPEYVKREIVYLAGASLIQMKTLEFIVEEWKKRFIDDKSRKPGEFQVNDAKIEKELKAGMQQFLKQYPTLDFWEVVRAQNGITKEQYMHQRRVIELFDMVFMNGAPDQWPMVTREAIKSGSQGGNPEDFWKGLVEGGRNPDGSVKEMPTMWKGMIRQMVMRQMQGWSDIKYAVDGVPAGVVMDVNGLKWSTGDAFNMIKENVFLQDLERAYTEVIIREALRQELVANKSLPTVKEFRAAYEKHEKEFEGSLFPLAMIATAFKGYPTIEAYRQRWRLMLGYEKLIAKEINDDNLEKHLKKYNRFFGDGTVNCDLISFLGKDGKTGAWRPDGMQEARKRAEAALAEIKGGASFDEILDKRGEYFHQDKDRGRMGSRSLNDLRRQMRESEYTDLVTGVSVGTWLYYTAEVGKVLGPVKGPDAYYIVRVNSRSPQRGDLSISDKGTRELVKQDYVSVRFLAWANKVLNRARIE